MIKNRPRSISFKINGVGIGNEADWPVIAKFHAKWTVKLYEVIVVPYLKPIYLETPTPVSPEKIQIRLIR